MDLLLIVYSFLIVVFVLIIPKGMLTAEIFRQRYKVNKLSALEWLVCYTPFRNTYIIKKAFDTPSWFFVWMNRLFPAFIFLTIIVRFAFPAGASNLNLLIQLCLTVLMLVVLLVTYIVEAYVHWDLCIMLDKRGLLWTIILPPLCSFLLTRHIKPYFKKNRHVIDGTFIGNNPA